MSAPDDRRDPATVDATAQIHATAVIDAPCRIGPRTRIWHFCHVMPHARNGADCQLAQNVFVGSGVAIGHRVKVQNNVSVFAGVTLADDGFVGPGAIFTNVRRPRAFRPRHGDYEPTTVQRGATIGAGAVIRCGITIGAYALVGAGAVVTQSVPAHALVVGNPARQIAWVCACGETLGSDNICPACQQEVTL